MLLEIYSYELSNNKNNIKTGLKSAPKRLVTIFFIVMAFLMCLHRDQIFCKHFYMRGRKIILTEI